jgi:hypothetical protein
LPLARSLLEFIILSLAVTYMLSYGLRLLGGDFSPIVLIYIFSSFGVAIWLYRVRQQELRERTNAKLASQPGLIHTKAQHLSLQVENTTRALGVLREKHEKGEMEEQEYQEEKKKLEDEISELSALDDAVFEAKQTVLKELGRRGKIQVSRLQKTMKNKLVLEEAIAELVEEGLLRRTGSDEYRYDYSGGNKSMIQGK